MNFHVLNKSNPMRSILLFCFVLCTGGQVFAQLTVADVRKTSVTLGGTIEEATLSVRTKGVYVECGLYLTFSARGCFFTTPADSLEVTLDFSLPSGSSITDYWLWIGDTISRAHIIQNYDAGVINGGIVSNQRVPSILYKTGNDKYRLKVFPMNKASTRRVKITWLQPISMNEERAGLSLSFPLKILSHSYYRVYTLNLSVWSDDRYKAPSILNLPNTKFEVVNDTAEFGQYYRTQLTPQQQYADYNNYEQLVFSSPLHNGYYLTTGESRGEKFYELAVLPTAFIPNVSHKKIAICLDYQASNVWYVGLSDVIASLKNSLINNSIEGDSFNLFYTNGTTVKQASNHWLPTRADAIEAVFKGLEPKIATVSNLQNMLNTCIDWMKGQGSEGFIVLATNGSQYANLTISNNLLSSFLNILPPGIHIHTIDYYNHYPQWYYFIWNGITYPGNNYLLSNLSLLSNGSYVKAGSYINTVEFATLFETVFSNLGENSSIFDFSTSVQNGFCYGIQDVSNGGSALINLNRPVIQIGKYLGDAPFHFNLGTVYQNQPFFAELDIPQSETYPCDTVIRQAWNEKFIQTLENATQNAASINTIINTSLDSRVLSKYTAFLCLEDTSYYCKDCLDETQTVHTDDLVASDSLLTAYPNPFSSHVTIQINAEFSKQEHPSFEVYDLKGQLVHYFTLSTGVNEQKIEWDGSSMSGDQIPAGVYIGLMKLKDRTVVLKLVKV